MGRRGYKCVLTSELTGKEYEFKTGTEASKFLGHNRNYVTTSVAKDWVIKDRHTGEHFTCTYVSVDVPEKMESRKQLCYFCKKATGGCSWSRFFKPVEGWTAKPTVIHHGIYNGKPRNMDSFAISECPEFEEG